MKAQTAKQIIANIIEWQLVLSGVKDADNMNLHDIDLRLYSLSDFMEANRVIHVCNQKAKTMHEHLKKLGKAKNGMRQYMTVEDRILAAVYTIINYDVDKQFRAIYENKGIAILEAKYL